MAFVVSGLEALYGQDVPVVQAQLQKIKKEFEGHLTFVAFPFLRISKRGPEQATQEIGGYLKANKSAVTAFNVIKGFLNLTIVSTVWIELLNEVHADAQYDIVSADENAPLVMIEYSSPNTNKPLHLGHVCNSPLGNAPANTVMANGNEIVKIDIVDDRGIYICKSILTWQKYGSGETPESSGRKGDYLIGDYYVALDRHYKAEVAGSMEKGMTKEETEAASPLMDEAREMLVKQEADDLEVHVPQQMINNWVYEGSDETHRKMRVSFDRTYYESNTYLEGREKAMEGLEKGFFFKKEDDLVWADLMAEGSDHELSFCGDGTPVCMIQDTGTTRLRFADCPINKMIYAVRNEQNYHFQVLSTLLDKLGSEWDESPAYFSYDMMEPPGGKMKSREDTVVDTDGLMAEMTATAKETPQELDKLDGLAQGEADDIACIAGLRALEYFVLKVDVRKNMTFNPKESTDFNGNTDPSIRYTYTRIQPVLCKAAGAGVATPQVSPTSIELSGKGEELTQVVADFAAAVHQAGEGYSPSGITNYVYDLVREYDQFYHDFSILREENEDVKPFRVALSTNITKITRLGMGLLGTEISDRM